jgi:hypothetical protein
LRGRLIDLLGEKREPKLPLLSSATKEKWCNCKLFDLFFLDDYISEPNRMTVVLKTNVACAR